MAFRSGRRRQDWHGWRFGQGLALAFFGGALAGEYASDSRIRHSRGSAVAFLKRLAGGRGHQRYYCGGVEDNKGGGEQDFNDR